MPLPKPNKDESRDQFVSRCIEDSVTESEFPNLSQRVAVCINLFEDKDEPKNLTVRRNKKCPDGYEHQMPDGSWMCGKTHKKKKSGYGNMYKKIKQIDNE